MGCHLRCHPSFARLRSRSDDTPHNTSHTARVFPHYTAEIINELAWGTGDRFSLFARALSHSLVGARPRRAGLDLSWGASEGLLTQGNVILKGGSLFQDFL